MARSATYLATRRVLHKPELQPEILAFIQEKQAVHSADIMRAYFPAGDTNQTSRYLRSMESRGLICSARRGKYLWWSLAGVEVADDELAARTPKSVSNPGPRPKKERTRRPTPVRPPRVTKTKEELQAAKNERTRRRRAERQGEEASLEVAELDAVEQWLTQVEARAQEAACGYHKAPPADEPDQEPEGMAEIRARHAVRRKESRERLEAGGKFYGWRTHEGFDRMGGGPTVYQLANFIHVRMKNDRKHKGWYRFTYEWVRSHYPHLLANYRDLVEDSLELLVIQGRIERLDMPS